MKKKVISMIISIMFLMMPQAALAESLDDEHVPEPTESVNIEEPKNAESEEVKQIEECDEKKEVITPITQKTETKPNAPKLKNIQTDKGTIKFIVDNAAYCELKLDGKKYNKISRFSDEIWAKGLNDNKTYSYEIRNVRNGLTSDGAIKGKIKITRSVDSVKHVAYKEFEKAVVYGKKSVKFSKPVNAYKYRTQWDNEWGFIRNFLYMDEGSYFYSIDINECDATFDKENRVTGFSRITYDKDLYVPVMKKYQKAYEAENKFHKKLQAYKKSHGTKKAIRYANDYIMKQTKYEYAYPKYIKKRAHFYKWTYVGVYSEKKTICQGYSIAFARAMDAIGVPNKYYVCKNRSHVYNRVKYKGKWYSVDVTWNDTARTHKYFMKRGLHKK